MEKPPSLALMGWRWMGLVGWIARRRNGGDMVRDLRRLRFVQEAREGMMEVRSSVLVKCMIQSSCVESLVSNLLGWKIIKLSFSLLSVPTVLV